MPTGVLQHGGAWIDLVGTAPGDEARVAVNKDANQHAQVMGLMINVGFSGPFCIDVAQQRLVCLPSSCCVVTVVSGSRPTAVGTETFRAL